MEGGAVEWDFGDGIHSTLANVEHKYKKPGRYVVTLMSTDSERECRRRCGGGTYFVFSSFESNDQDYFGPFDLDICWFTHFGFLAWEAQEVPS